MNKFIKVLLIIIAIILVASIGYLAGSMVNKNKNTNSEPQINQDVTFYAQIKEINGSNLLVEGLDTNDINYRSEFSFKIKDETKIEFNNEDRKLSDLKIGQNVAIKFSGEIQETYPAVIINVIDIRILSENISTNTITNEDAIRLVEEKYGTSDKETGYTYSYGYVATVQDKDRNEYYAIRQSWLVDDHMSFVKNIFVSLDGKTFKTSENSVGFEENEVVDFK